MHGHFGSRSGQQASLLPIFETRPPTPMADAETAKPPEAIPDRYKDAVGKLDPRAQALYITPSMALVHAGCNGDRRDVLGK